TAAGRSVTHPGTAFPGARRTSGSASAVMSAIGRAAKYRSTQAGRRRRASAKRSGARVRYVATPMAANVRTRARLIAVPSRSVRGGGGGRGPYRGRAITRRQANAQRRRAEPGERDVPGAPNRGLNREGHDRGDRGDRPLPGRLDGPCEDRDEDGREHEVEPVAVGIGDAAPEDASGRGADVPREVGGGGRAGIVGRVRTMRREARHREGVRLVGEP